jgi:polyisoprenoid-binding protein YceI
LQNKKLVYFCQKFKNKMKKLFYSIFAVAAMTMVSCGGGEATTEGEGHGTDSTEAVVAIAGTYNTAEGASIVWKAKHYADADYVHVGTVPTTGSVVVDNNAVIGGEFTFDIVKLDENGDTDYTKMLEGHLQDSTLFNTMLFPTATFTITGSEAGKVMGDLTVLGVSQAITIEGELAITDAEVALVGSTTIDMLGFSMPYLLMSEQAPEEEKGQSPDPKIVIEIDLKLAKAAM